MAVTRKISAMELAKHTAYDDCWMAIQGKVYDLTKFMDDHPGGDEVLKDSAGRDATAEFDDVGHSEEAWAMMEEYYIGDFAVSAACSGGSTPALSSRSFHPPSTTETLGDAELLVETFVEYEYESEVQEELTCPICTEPAVRALKLCEDHLICTECVPMLGERSTCPVCSHALPTNAEGQRALPLASRLVVRMLGKLLVRCTVDGCSWSGPRANLRDHLLVSCECIPCTHKKEGCDFRGCGKSVSIHTEEDCPHQPISCPGKEDGCDATLPRGLLKEHRRSPAECVALQRSLEREREIAEHKAFEEAERRREEARKRLTEAAALIANVETLSFVIQGRTFTVGRRLLLGKRCTNSVLELLARDHDEDASDIRLDCGVREMERVVSWVRYGTISGQATMTDVEWEEQLRVAEALHLEKFLEELRKPSQVAVAALVMARGGMVRFFACDLSGKSLLNMNLSHSDLSGTNLTNANLTNANLTNVDLTGANLTNANLTNANLTNVDLTGANLTNADLTNANLTGANLTSPDLTNAMDSRHPVRS